MGTYDLKSDATLPSVVSTPSRHVGWRSHIFTKIVYVLLVIWGVRMLHSTMYLRAFLPDAISAEHVDEPDFDWLSVRSPFCTTYFS